ncbi:MAG: hypothetical protein OXT65_12605 [Alphaproteobacteria bacterium]|nr:hypothetical protein [Alphaproteobacteria bacterium]
MVEAVSTLSVKGSGQRVPPQASASVASSPSALNVARDLVASRIRMDNLQNVAILEYRSSEGEILRQYPTQKQIDAFKQAQRLAERGREARVAAEAARSAPRSEAAAVAPEGVPVAAPTETASAPSAPSEDSAGDSGAAPQSIVV